MQSHGMTDSKSSLFSLPVEILHQVFSYLSIEDVISARICCHLLADVGAQHFLFGVYLSYSYSSFKRLVEISKHSLISKNLRSLNYNGDRYDEYNTVLSWLDSSTIHPRLVRSQIGDAVFAMPGRIDYTDSQRERLKTIEGWGSDPPSGVLSLQDEELRAAYCVYRSLFEDQQRAGSDLDVRCLTSAFERCPNLDNVTLSITIQPRAKTPRILASPELPVRARAQHNDEDAGVHDFRCLCKAAKLANKRLRRLTVSELGCGVLCLPQSDLHIIKSSLRYMRVFKLGMSDITRGMGRETQRFVSEGVRTAFRDGILRDIVTSMPRLHTLKLVMSQNKHHPFIDLDCVVGNYTWPKLRDIALKGMLTTEDALVDFILRHKDKLRRLTLSFIRLTAGSWQSLFRRIAGKCPRLRKVRLIAALAADENRSLNEFYFRLWGDNYHESVSLLQDAFQTYVRDGGEYPEVAVSQPPEPEDPVWRPVEPDFPDEDGGYDSDGSHVSYGSDEFDMQI